MFEIDPDLWLRGIGRLDLFHQSNDANGDGLEKDSQSVGVGCKRKIQLVSSIMILAVGKELRVADLKALKLASLTEDKGIQPLEMVERRGDMDFELDNVVSRMNRIGYIRIKSEKLDSDIKQITINQSGSMLGLITYSGHVYAIPLRIHRWEKKLGELCGGIIENSKINRQADDEKRHVLTLEVNAIRVGGDIGKNNSAIEIKWHPLSSTDRHLVVLCADSSLRMYDINANPTEPEQVVAREKRKRGTYGQLSMDMGSFVSFSIGNLRQGLWERVTCFVLEDSGNIFAVTPFVPKSFLVERSWADRLFEMASMDVMELQAQEFVNSGQLVIPPKLQDCRRGLEWIRGVVQTLNQAETDVHGSIWAKTDVPTEGNGLLSVDLPDTFLGDLRFQGPFSVQPSPPEISDADVDYDLCEFSDDATDILVLQTQPVSVIAVGYCGGRVNLFAVVELIEPSWILERPDLAVGCVRKEPTLLTLQAIETQAQVFGPTCFSGCVLSRQCFYSSTSTGVYRIDVSRWIGEIENVFSGEKNTIRTTNYSSDNSDLGKLVQNLELKETITSQNVISASVRCIASIESEDNNNNQIISGLAQVEDAYISYSLIVLLDSTTNIKGLGVPLLLPSEEKRLVESDPEIINMFKKLNPQSQSPDTPRLYDSLLTESSIISANSTRSSLYSAIDSAIGFLNSSQPSVALIARPGVDGNKLKTLGAFVAQTRYHMDRVLKSNLELRVRFEALAAEFKLQKTVISRLSNALEATPPSKIEHYLSRINKLKTNQLILLRRLEKLLLLVSYSRANSYTQTEIDSIKKLDALNALVCGDSDSNNTVLSSRDSGLSNRAQFLKHFLLESDTTQASSSARNASEDVSNTRATAPVITSRSFYRAPSLPTSSLENADIASNADSQCASVVDGGEDSASKGRDSLNVSQTLLYHDYDIKAMRNTIVELADLITN
ncbi:Nucleoporin nup82 [Zancudomyces culisetae]|uniref:Nucleoporin nup82 n=1 Tax=Zancudomyces culisetae TaxID=1213189 RepID=A0A1R1PPC5_ZANCU|nr:Nucleoporin nup82 [Zancudomyces culisetae]|eukprot:OMH82809.1 Nucleoporin nup82 [Zancudomyces culisetae]